MVKDQSKNKILEEKNLWKLIMQMSLPGVISGISTSLIFFIDSLMASGLSEINSIEISSGIGIALSTITIVTTTIIVFNNGAVIRHAFLSSKKETEPLKYNAGASFTGSLFFTLFVMALISALANPIVESQSGGNELIVNYGKKYLYMTISWLPLFVIYADLSSFVRIDGKISEPILITVFSIAVNIGFNYIFLLTDLDPVIAVSLSTLLVQFFKVISLTFLIFKMKRMNEITLFSGWRYYKPNFKIMLTVLALGSPVMLRNLLINTDNIIIGIQLTSSEVPSGVNLTSGEFYAPLVSAYNQVYSIAINIISGFALGGSVAIIYNYGKKNFKETKKSVLIIGVYILISAIIVAVISISLSGPILSLFNIDVSTYSEYLQIFNVLIFRIVLLSISYLIFSFFLNTYQIKKSFLTFLIHSTILFIPITFIFFHFFDTTTAIYSYLLVEAVYLLFAITFFTYDLITLEKQFNSKEIDMLSIQKWIRKIRYINYHNIMMRNENELQKNLNKLHYTSNRKKKLKISERSYKNINNVKKIKDLELNDKKYKEYLMRKERKNLKRNQIITTLNHEGTLTTIIETSKNNSSNKNNKK